MSAFICYDGFVKNYKEQGVVDDGVYPRCSGYHKRGICVYGIGDVGWVSTIIC